MPLTAPTRSVVAVCATMLSVAMVAALVLVRSIVGRTDIGLLAGVGIIVVAGLVSWFAISWRAADGLAATVRAAVVVGVEAVLLMRLEPLIVEKYPWVSQVGEPDYDPGLVPVGEVLWLISGCGGLVVIPACVVLVFGSAVLLRRRWRSTAGSTR